MQYTYWDIFFLCSKQSLNLLILMPFSASAVFCFTSPRWQNVPIWGLLSSRETKKLLRGDIRWIGRVGQGDHAVFGQKLLNTQHNVSRCIGKSPIMKWANALKGSLKQIHWNWMQPLTTMPAGTLIQMGSKNTHLVGEAYTTRGLPSRR